MTKRKLAPLKPKVVLGVAAHPDDLEFGVAGTVATYVAQGAKAYYLILTNGNKGSEDRSLSPEKLRDMRRSEQRRAAKLLGVSKVFFCDYEDGGLECCSDVKQDIVRIIRTVKPDVLLTMDPTMIYSAERGFINHPDHRAAGQATLDAAYPLARDHLSFPKLHLQEQLEPHKVGTVLLTNFEKQNFYVDISAQIETKLKALAAHTSQIGNPDQTLAMVKQRAKQTGGQANMPYAESFMRIDLPG